MHPGVRTILEKFFEFEDQRPNTEDPEYSSKYESSGAKIIDLNLISEFLIKHGIYKDFETRENMAVVLESVDQKALQLIYMLILAAFVKEIDYMNDEKKAELIELVNRFNQQVGRDLIDSITALEQLLECEKLKRFELLQELRAIGIDVNALRPQMPPKQARAESAPQTQKTNRGLFPEETITSEAPPPSGLVRQAASAAEANGDRQVAGSRRPPPKLLPKPGKEIAVSEPTVTEAQPAPPPATRDQLPKTSLSDLEKHRLALLKRRSAVCGDSPAKTVKAGTSPAMARNTTDENREPPQNGSRARSLSRSASAAERPAFFASIISGDGKASLRATATRVGINQEEAPKASTGIAASLLSSADSYVKRVGLITPPEDSQNNFEQSFTPSPTRPKSR